MTKADPLFSIITPSFNQVDFIEDTIKSVLDQAGPFVIEYVIADGGSTDGSLEIIKKYDRLIKESKFSLKNKGVIYRWWSRPDKGQPDALNQGFKTSRGKYMAWINSDDVYEKDALAQAAKAFEKNQGAGMVYGNFSEIDAHGKVLRPMKVMPFDLSIEINSGNIVPTPSTFFSRKAIFDVGLINPKYHYAFDYDLFIKVAKKYPVIYVDSYWSKFRLHETSKTVSLEKKFWPEEREISRAHGARFFSQHLINHHARYHPRTTFLAVKTVRTIRLLLRGRFIVVIKKILNNIRHTLRNKK